MCDIISIVFASCILFVSKAVHFNAFDEVSNLQIGFHVQQFQQNYWKIEIKLVSVLYKRQTLIEIILNNIQMRASFCLKTIGWCHDPFDIINSIKKTKKVKNKRDWIIHTKRIPAEYPMRTSYFELCFF